MVQDAILGMFLQILFSLVPSSYQVFILPDPSKRIERRSYRWCFPPQSSCSSLFVCTWPNRQSRRCPLSFLYFSNLAAYICPWLWWYFEFPSFLYSDASPHRYRTFNHASHKIFPYNSLCLFNIFLPSRILYVSVFVLCSHTVQEWRSIPQLYCLEGHFFFFPLKADDSCVDRSSKLNSCKKLAQNNSKPLHQLLWT